jgi:hypothetical protein
MEVRIVLWGSTMATTTDLVGKTWGMTGAQVLAEWEERYGALSVERRARFLEKGGHVERLAQLPDDVVREAIFNRRRLDEIEAFATGRPSPGVGRPAIRLDDRHHSEYGSVTIRRPGRPEQVVDHRSCDSCGRRLTPEGRCGCS